MVFWSQIGRGLHKHAVAYSLADYKALGLRRIAATLTDLRLWVLDVATGQKIAISPAWEISANSVAFSPDDRRIAITVDGRHVVVVGCRYRPRNRDHRGVIHPH